MSNPLPGESGIRIDANQKVHAFLILEKYLTVKNNGLYLLERNDPGGNREVAYEHE